MTARVQQLTRDDVMLPERKFAAQRHVPGLIELGPAPTDPGKWVTRRARLLDPTTTVNPDLLEPLWDPVVEAIGASFIRIRGLQRSGDKLVLQVWLCDVG